MRSFGWWFSIGALLTLSVLMVQGGVRDLLDGAPPGSGASPYLFERKRGVWDPLVGLGWHTARDKYEIHSTFEVGGFGVGTDIEYAASFRADWKPFRHFGLTGGYQFLYFKVEDEIVNRPLTVKQTLQGPIVGIGLYF